MLNHAGHHHHPHAVQRIVLRSSHPCLSLLTLQAWEIMSELSTHPYSEVNPPCLSEGIISHNVIANLLSKKDLDPDSSLWQLLLRAPQVSAANATDRQTLSLLAARMILLDTGFSSTSLIQNVNKLLPCVFRWPLP